MRWAPALLMRSSFHCLSSASGIAMPGCSRSLATYPSNDIDMYRMTFRTNLLSGRYPAAAEVSHRVLHLHGTQSPWPSRSSAVTKQGIADDSDEREVGEDR